MLRIRDSDLFFMFPDGIKFDAVMAERYFSSAVLFMKTDSQFLNEDR